jgi:hypothetical protein
VAVFAIWLPMLAGDDAGAIDRRMFDDPRVTSFWDPHRIVGNWFGQHSVGGLGGEGFTVWDAFYGFRGSARWAAAPTGVVAAGSDIIGNTGRLEHEFVPLLR